MPRTVGYKRKRSRSRSKSKSRSKPRRTGSVSKAGKLVRFGKRVQKPKRRPTRVVSRTYMRKSTPYRKTNVSKTKLRRDPRPRTTRKQSLLPTERRAIHPVKLDDVSKFFRPRISSEERVKKVGRKIKHQFDFAKKWKNIIAEGVAATAHGVGEVARVVEPMALGGAAVQPEFSEVLLPIAAAAEGAKRTADVIEKTAKATAGDKDAYHKLMEHNKAKFQRAIGDQLDFPDTNLITMDEVRDNPRYVPALPMDVETID